MVGYMVYGRIAERVFGPDDRPTPAVRKADGIDYIVLPGWRIFMMKILNTLNNVFDIQRVTNYICNWSNKPPTAWVFYRHCSELMGTLPIAG